MASSYIRSLDGLRALAVILVLLHHWPFPVLSLPFAWLGVNIFFVLSGFLITRILTEARTQPFKNYIGNFYRNRILRIFPLYYAYLAVISVILTLIIYFHPDPQLALRLGFVAVKNDIWYLVTYTYNFQDLWHRWDANDDSNHVRFFSHLWSLAVEEQYYLIFPFLVYFLSRNSLKKLFIAICLLTPLLRLAVGEYFRGTEPDHFIGMILSRLSLFHFDGFALGGLIALSNWEKFKNPTLKFIGFTCICVVSGMFKVWILRNNGIEISRKSMGFDHPLYQYMQQTGNWFLDHRYALTFTLVNIISALCLLACLQQTRLAEFLKKNIFVSIGRISYGIYVLHFPILAFLLVVLEHFGLTEKMKANAFFELVVFAAFFVVVIFTAWASFRFFESRFLRFKHKHLPLNSEVPAPKSTY